MRDPKLMLSLLRQMASDDYGRLTMPASFGMSAEEQRHRHHLELLIDAGRAEWTGRQMSIARITNAGYDFINAVDQGEEFINRFLNLINKGIRVGQAMDTIVEMVSKSVEN